VHPEYKITATHAWPQGEKMLAGRGLEWKRGMAVTILNGEALLMDHSGAERERHRSTVPPRKSPLGKTRTARLSIFLC